MKFAPLAVLLAAAAVALAGCGGASHPWSGWSTVSQEPQDSKAAEIGAARASAAELFSIFPQLPGQKSCAIPAGGMAGATLQATCRTSVTYPNEHGRYAEAFVTFRESWESDHHSSWTLIVQWPAEKVVATQLHGEVSPQMRYAAAD